MTPVKGYFYPDYKLITATVHVSSNGLFEIFKCFLAHLDAENAVGILHIVCNVLVDFPIHT